MIKQGRTSIQQRMHIKVNAPPLLKSQHIPTMKVRRIETGDVVIINQKDYGTDRFPGDEYERIDAAPKVQAAPKAVKAKARSSQTKDELAAMQMKALLKLPELAGADATQFKNKDEAIAAILAAREAADNDAGVVEEKKPTRERETL